MSSRNVTQDDGEFGAVAEDGEAGERVGELGGAGAGGLDQEATNVSESRSEERFLTPEPNKPGQFIAGPPAVTAFVTSLAASNRAKRGKKGTC